MNAVDLLESLKQLWAGLYSFLDGFAVVVASITLAYATVTNWKARSSYLRKLSALRATSKEGVIAVAVGIGADITKDVENFLQKNFPNVQLAVKVMKSGVVPAIELKNIVKEIRREMKLAAESGDVRKALFFFNGPYAVAVGVGAIADNLVPLDIYQFNQQKMTYEFAYTLDLDVTRGD